MKSENTIHKIQLDSQLGKLKDRVSFIVPNVLQEYFFETTENLYFKLFIIVYFLH